MAISEYLRGIREHIGSELVMLPGVNAIVFNDRGEILLGRRSDDGLWGLPAGAIDPGEQPAEAAARETWEETGVEVEVERIVGVGAYPALYPNGDQCYYVSIWFRCRAVGGEARVNDEESTEVRWFAYDELPDLPERVRMRIDLAIADGPAWFSPVGSDNPAQPSPA